MPIAISLGLTSVVAISYFLADGFPLSSIAQKLFTSLDSFPLMAIPFFIMAGTVMEYAGISKRLIRLAAAIVGGVHGGLGMVVVISALIFGALSGSGIATTAALGTILIPAMIRQGYDRSFAGATQVAAGELGGIIPPSISLVLYGVTVGVSVGDLFIGGVGPGVMIGLSLLMVVYVVSRIRGYKRTVENFTWKGRLDAFVKAVPAVFMAVIILGGIYGGIFTPTESAAVAIGYALVIGLFVYKEIKLKDIIPIFIKSIITSAAIMYIMANASIFSWVLVLEGIPQLVAGFFTDLTASPFIFLLAINLLLLTAGMFIDGLTAIIVLAPLLTPAAIALGVDPIHFGVLMVVNLAIGMCTPPIGLGLFIGSQIANARIGSIAKAIVPFLIVLILDLVVLSLFPEITLYLVNLKGD